MIRSYDQAVKFLEHYIPAPKRIHPGKLGLERMEQLAELLGNPQEGMKFVHVGGTSGKGSTATIAASILATRYKTGLHTSPHLKRINERFKILKLKTQNSNVKTKYKNSNLFEDVLDSEFVELVNEIKPAVVRMEKSNLEAPSYFEIVTAMALVYFKKQKTEFAVIEVGMGGRFDATNIIRPETAILTNVGLDHTEVLGETVEEIAMDKAGIIKKGTKLVSGVKQKTVTEYIKSVCKSRDAECQILSRDFTFRIREISDDGTHFDYKGTGNLKNLFLPLLGVHQAENAALAIRAVELTGDFGEEEIRTGLNNSFIPGRMEIVGRKPFVVVDGAHNADKMKALADAMKTIWPKKKLITVLAIKKGKKAEEMLKLITPISRRIILTEYKILMDQGVIESYKADELKITAERLGYKGEVTVVRNAKKALDLAKSGAGKEDIILITGSLYLTGLII